MTREEKNADAHDSHEWLQAYLDAGFTRREAMLILTRPTVTINQNPAPYPPELHEFWERQTALATKLMAEGDDDE